MSAGRLTYSDLWTFFRNNTGNSGSSDSTLSSFFNIVLSARYQDMLAKMDNYTTQPPPTTAATVADQQYYHNPPGVSKIEAVSVDIGDQVIPLVVVNSEQIWNHLNYVTLSNYPTHIFPRRDDFGLYPIPDAAYTINFGFHKQDRSLTNADVTTGTVSVTQNDATITHSGTSFTATMVGRWFKVDNDGYWYRINSFTSTSSMELESVYEGSTGSSLTFVIGESPELPVEMHIGLGYGTTADYFAGWRKDKSTHDLWESKYVNVLNNGMEKYSQRADKRIVYRNQVRKNDENVSFLWSKTITS